MSRVWDMYIAAQGGHKDVKKYTDILEPAKELGVEDLLRNIKKGKG